MESQQHQQRQPSWISVRQRQFGQQYATAGSEQAWQQRKAVAFQIFNMWAQKFKFTAAGQTFPGFLPLF